MVVCAAAALFGAAAWTAWSLAPSFCSDPFTDLKKQTPCRSYYDRQGKLLHIERTYDYQWRFDIPLEQISQEAVDVILAAEDARFYDHNGVDLQAVARAAWQNLTSGRIISGASTISMQLVSIARPRKRSFKTKFIQAAEARKMEKLHSKREILTEYLNRIPFGGKIHGIQAAAIYYFGLDAKALNRAEASLLCGLPQRPNAYRPDRHPEQARKRQKLVLKLMERNGFLKPGMAQEIYENEPLRLRDFRYPSALRSYARPSHRHYFTMARREARNAFDVKCAIDVEFTERIQHALSQHVQQLQGVHDAAAVLIDNRTRQVVSLVGTLDYNDPLNGQVNAATAIRSAGSTLKPFIYLEAFDAGLATMDTIIKDTPIRFGDYAPTNYDGRFNQKLRIAEALSLSLNTPAVRLVAELTPERVIDLFASLRLTAPTDSPDAQTAKKHGLSIALGTMGHSLLNLAQGRTRTRFHAGRLRLGHENPVHAAAGRRYIRRNRLENRDIQWKPRCLVLRLHGGLHARRMVRQQERPAGRRTRRRLGGRPRSRRYLQRHLPQFRTFSLAGFVRPAAVAAALREIRPCGDAVLPEAIRRNDSPIDPPPSMRPMRRLREKSAHHHSFTAAGALRRRRRRHGETPPARIDLAGSVVRRQRLYRRKFAL